jgi:hypothetical protein
MIRCLTYDVELLRQLIRLGRDRRESCPGVLPGGEVENKWQPVRFEGGAVGTNLACGGSLAPAGDLGLVIPVCPLTSGPRTPDLFANLGVRGRTLVGVSPGAA